VADEELPKVLRKRDRVLPSLLEPVAFQEGNLFAQGSTLLLKPVAR
jgi:hypothetical protein